MMSENQCSECGEKLDTTSGKSINFCPNCGNKITNNPAAIHNAKSALHHIAEQTYQFGGKEVDGISVLLSSKIAPIFSDITQGQFPAERKLIQLLQEEGALNDLKNALNSSPVEQVIAIKRATAKLPFAKAEGEAMLYDFAEVLGWTVDVKVPQVEPLPYNLLPPGTSVYARSVKKMRVTFDGIDWIVLDIQDDRALLLSEKVIEDRIYHKEIVDITWEQCNLRNYLNGEFYDRLDTLKAVIIETNNQNPDNLWYGTKGGRDTNDKVFLLSLEEADGYFGNSNDYIGKKRKDEDGYLDANGNFLNNQYNNDRVAVNSEGKVSWWWLRTSGHSSHLASYVRDGIMHVSGTIVGIRNGVRPALWIRITP